MPGTSSQPLGSRGFPGHAPGTREDAPGFPGHAPGTPRQAPGTPGDALGTPGHAPGTPGHAAGTPGTSLRHPGGAPGTPGDLLGPLMDHKNGHISANRQRQKLSIAVNDSTGPFSP